jgi:integrase
VFFDRACPNSLARALGRNLTLDHEVFPRQEVISEGSYGSLIKAPLGKHQIIGQWCLFVDEDLSQLENPNKVLAEAKTFNPETLPYLNSFVNLQPPNQGDPSEERGLAFNTIRLRLQPVKMAWRFAMENWPDEVWPLPRNRLSVTAPREIDCLGPKEVAALLDWLRNREPDLWAMASLQVLAGLRVLEAAAIRRQDVDLARGTVRITDTGFHKPKTACSERIIPVCPEALKTLVEWMNGQKVVPATGELFWTRLGTRWTPNSLTHRWKRKPVDPKPSSLKGIAGVVLYRAAKETGVPRLADLQPHRLRASFATMASQLQVPDRLLKAYLGHAPGDVLGILHYRRIDLAELRLVSSRMEGWRNLEDRCQEWQENNNSEISAFVRS